MIGSASVDVIVLGTGGTSRDIVDALDDLRRTGDAVGLRCRGYLDDDVSRHGEYVDNLPVLGPLRTAASHLGCAFVNGIGSPMTYRARPDIIARTGLDDEAFLTVVHPSATVSRRARLGPGTVVLANATVSAGAVLGAHVTVLPSAVISHDTRIGDYTCVAGGAAIAGEVTIGEACYIGAASALIGGIDVGDRALVGMGAVVLGDVAADSIVVGNPARPLLRTVHDAVSSSGGPT